MKIELLQVSKRFNYEWIFRDISFTFQSDNAYALTGQNGSGKSTLLKILSGQLTPSAGVITFHDPHLVSIDKIFSEIAFTAPYIDLIDDFNLKEYLEFHFSFKKTCHNYSIQQLLQISGLQKQQNKSLKSFSSGMKQRVKLVTTILSDTPVLLLDEPTSNLDAEGVLWYQDLINANKKDRIVIVGSNMEREYIFCPHIIAMADYKQ